MSKAIIVPLKCMVCGAAILDLSTGWAKARPDTPIYGLCSPDAARIGQDIALRWNPDGSPELTFGHETLVQRVERRMGRDRFRSMLEEIDEFLTERRQP